MTKYECFDIIWDTDGISIDDLPEEAIVECSDAEEVADILSDEYGWCVKSLTIRELKKRNVVSFGVVWECYGRAEIPLPDDIDLNDIDAVKAYIRSVWDDMPLPHGEYVQGSDEIDEESDIRIKKAWVPDETV